MKLDIFTNQWLDIVFEGRNKAYGAYELKENNKTTVKAYIWCNCFAIAVSMPLILSLFQILQMVMTL
jgi:protein TonB